MTSDRGVNINYSLSQTMNESLVCTCSHVLQADQESENKKELEPCSDNPESWPEGSAMHALLILVPQLQQLSAELKTKHDELITFLSNSLNSDGEKHPDLNIISALIMQQRSWEKYKSDECKLLGLLSGAGGAWPTFHATYYEFELTKARLHHINSVINCIQTIPLQSRLVEQNECLRQLAPLTNPQ